MTRLFGFILLTILLFSCQEKEPLEPIIKVKKIEANIPEEDLFDYDTLQGMYIGDFGGTDIRIILNYVSGSNAIGYNLHKGLQRNLNGKVNRSGDSVIIELNEPGDHKFDGVFNLTFNGIDNNPTGSWKSNSGEIAEKSFSLAKQIKEEIEGEITPSNFTRYFNFMYDTIGNYTFSADGLLKYEYYPSDIDSEKQEQLSTIQGSWNLQDSIVTFDWQENVRFKNRRMVFIIKKDAEYIEGSHLEGEGMSLYNHWY